MGIELRGKNLPNLFNLKTLSVGISVSCPAYNGTVQGSPSRDQDG